MENEENVVLACSALERGNRDYLRRAADRAAVVQLAAPADIVRARMESRQGHFMPASLLDSQYETLEQANDTVVVDASRPVEEVVVAIRNRLGV